jgi:hypothetical protein
MLNNKKEFNQIKFNKSNKKPFIIIEGVFVAFNVCLLQKWLVCPDRRGRR